MIVFYSPFNIMVVIRNLIIFAKTLFENIKTIKNYGFFCINLFVVSISLNTSNFFRSLLDLTTRVKIKNIIIKARKIKYILIIKSTISAMKVCFRQIDRT